jgi:hypothetical protein
MKTAVETLDEYGCPEIPFNENIVMYYPSIINAMDDYAQQVADEYARYVCRRALYYDIKQNLWFDQYVEGGFTSDEIYAQFEADRKANY